MLARCGKKEGKANASVPDLVRRVGLVRAATAVALGAPLILFSCLPDLPVIPPAEGGTVSVGSCGDSVIQQASDGGGEQCDPAVTITPGCTDDCRLICDDGFILWPGGHCYFSPPTKRVAKYSDAVELCRSQSAHVVTVSSAEESAFIQAKLFPGNAVGYWVGLSELPSEGAFGSAVIDEPGFPIPPQSGPCSGCFGGAGVSGADAGLPSDLATDAGPLSCVKASSETGRWLRVPCGQGAELDVVCEREPAGGRAEPCVGGVCVAVSVTLDQKTYLYVPTLATAAQAKASCATIGGRLVVFSREREREELAREIRALLPPPTLVEFWVGLSNEGNGEWRWDDGVREADRPLAWASKEPQASGRAILRLSGAFDTALLRSDGSPEASHAYVCERALGPKALP